MRHLYDLVTSPRFDIKDLAEADTMVTLKIDGTAMQSIINDGKPEGFRKRSTSPFKEGPKIERLDLICNPAFADAVTELGTMKKEKSDVLKEISILNMELVTNENPHIVSYKAVTSPRTVLLSAVTRNGRMMDTAVTDEIAKNLGMERPPMLFNGKLGEERADKLVDFCKEYCDPHNPKPVGDGKFMEELCKGVLGVEVPSSEFGDTEDGFGEGVAITLTDGNGKKTFAKLDDPLFTIAFKEESEGKGDSKDIETEVALNAVYRRFVKNSLTTKKCKGSNLLAAMLDNYSRLTSKDKGLEGFLAHMQKRGNLPTMLRYSTSKSLIPKEYRPLATNPDFFPAFRLFVWLLLRPREGKSLRYPILSRFSSLAIGD